MRQNLEFRGSSTSLFGTLLLVALLTLITFGIYTPWGVARMRRAVLSRTYYHDKPLDFDGTGGELFVIMLKVLLFTILTLGIYDLLCYPQIAYLKWDASHTILPNGNRLEYRGTALDLFGQVLLVGLLTSITLGIYAFWGYARLRRVVLSNTFVEGQPLQFTGTGGQYLGIVLANVILTLITLTIYEILGCASVRTLRWDCQNTILPHTSDEAQGPFAVGGRPIQVTVNVNQ